MTKLSENWITESRIDFEYKKYMLLAWLQKVDENFKTVQLYPSLAELVAHHTNACKLKANKTLMESKFPRTLKGLGQDQHSLLFEPALRNETALEEVDRILQFSIPEFERWLNEGKSIYEFIENEIEISPVGIVPLRTDEGYLLLSQGKQDTRVYSFQMTIFEEPESKWRSLKTAHVADWKKTFTNTFESIKIELIRTLTALPNPAVYVAACSKEIPLEAAFLPVAKRMLMREISSPE